MVSNESIGCFKSCIGPECSLGVSLTDRDLPFDANELLERFLFNDPYRTDKVDEWGCTAIHDRDLFGRKFNDEIIDAQTPKRRHQMFNSGNLQTIASKTG